jgi:ribosome-binding factor A
LLDSEINDERLQGAWITAVELTPDCAFARVWYTMTDETFWEDGQLGASFERASGFFRRRLCEELALKRTPELRFQCDPGAHGGAGEEGTLFGSSEKVVSR